MNYMASPTTQVPFMVVITSRKPTLPLLNNFRDARASDGSWYRCNDSSISKISKPDHANSSSAYVLFFVKS